MPKGYANAIPKPGGPPEACGIKISDPAHFRFLVFGFHRNYVPGMSATKYEHPSQAGVENVSCSFIFSKKKLNFLKNFLKTFKVWGLDQNGY